MTTTVTAPGTLANPSSLGFYRTVLHPVSPQD